MITAMLLLGLAGIARRMIRSWSQTTPRLDVLSDIAVLAVCVYAAVFTIHGINH